jgi:photosystem II stability/assembly factor-like uncharacterized protein
MLTHRSRGIILGLAAAIGLAHWAYSQPAPATSEAQLFRALPARSIGPVACGGRVTDLAVVESSPDIMYVAAAIGGVWKTNDGGATWRPTFDQAGSLCIGDVTVAPSNPDIVWVGTGEANILRSVSVGDGVYKSTDGGKTWKHMGLKETRHIGRIVIHPKNPDIVYVAALGRAWGPSEERGIYKTTDGGKTWEKFLYIDDTTGIIDLAMDPAEANILYACAYTFRRDAFSGTYPRTQFGPKAGLYKSVDGGKKWTRLTEGLPQRPLGRCGIDICRKDPKLLYAVVETDKSDDKSPEGGGIFRSEDRGETWVQVHSMFRDFPFYFGQIRIDPSEPRQIYVLGIQVHASNDGGKTFTTTAGGTHADNHALWIDPNNSDFIVLGNDGGLFFSKNRGKAWQPIRGIVNAQFYAIGVDMGKPYRVYGGMQDTGSWGTPSATYSEAGIVPKDARSIGGGDGFYCQVDPTDPDTVYCETQYGVLRRVNLKQKDKSKNIRPSAGKGEAAYRFNWNAPVLISPHDARTLYFGGNFLFKSTNQGDTWEKISPDLTRGGKAEDTGHSITTIAESPLKAGLLWVGSDDGRVHVYRNGGKDWTEVTEAIPALAKDGWVTRVECSHHAEGTCFVTIDRHRNDDLRPYIYKTTDYGVTWQPIVGDLPAEGNVHVIRQSSKNADLLFLGTEFGLYGTLDGGKHWHRMTNGLPPAVLVHDLIIHPRDRELVVGTHGRGLYIFDIAPLEELTAEVRGRAVYMCEIKSATAFKLLPLEKGKDSPAHALPNPPYGAAISIYLRETGAQALSLTILDQDNKTVAILKPSSTPGLQQLIWNLRSESGELVSPGEYTARLQIGDQNLTKKFRVEDE